MLELSRQVARFDSWNARANKHGDQRVPAGDLQLSIKASNTMLDQIDQTLRPMFYRRTNAATRQQADLPGTEMTDTPALATNRIHDVDIRYEIAGYALEIYRGIGDEPLIELRDVTVDKMSATLFEGGTIELSFRVKANEVDAVQSGALHMLLMQDIDIKLIAPEAEPSMLDGEDED